MARKLKADFPDAKLFNRPLGRKGELKKLVKNVFSQYEGMIIIAALGITVRVISGLIKNKFNDPAVVSVDTAGRFSISVLSGHQGGANRLASLAAASLGALPIITTGKEVHKKFIIGIGTRRGVDSDTVKGAIKKAIKMRRLRLEAIRLAATINLKKNEAGLLQACRDLGVPLVFVSKHDIGNFRPVLSRSKVVRQYIGLDGVCEPCALLSGRRTKLILKKEIIDGVAIAIAEEN